MKPTPEEQLVFLSKLQRLFAEGDFTATYKFALLISLAELAVENGRDDGESLKLSLRQIAAKFIELYWQQVAPYSRGVEMPGVLAQNNGAPAAVLTAIADFRRLHPMATAQTASLASSYADLIKKVAQTVSAQPVTYLQNLGGQTDAFLYDRHRGGITLKPGTAFCLRRFQPLLQQLARNHWIGHIKRNHRNRLLLGDFDDLESFLFETPRQALTVIGEGLRQVANDRCFYCGSKVHGADVDHFIPFSMYPRDLAHNFVLAHPSCNRSKSDTLAAKVHLERWVEHISRNDDAIREIGEQAGRPTERASCQAVVRWAYGNAVTSEAQAWLQAKSYESVTADYLRCLS